MPAVSVTSMNRPPPSLRYKRSGTGSIRAGAAVVAGTDGVVAGLVAGEGEVEIVGDEEIEIAVAIVVDERGARAPPGVADAGGLGDVGERAVAVVAVQRLRAERGHEEIEVAVVVVVADRRAHAIGAGADAGGVSNVGEVELARLVRCDSEVVAEQTARRGGGPGLVRPG